VSVNRDRPDETAGPGPAETFFGEPPAGDDNPGGFMSNDQSGGHEPDPQDDAEETT